MYQERLGTVQDALDLIHSGDVIWTSNNYNESRFLLSHIHEIAPRLENVTLYKSRIEEYPFLFQPGMDQHILCINYFYGPAYRKAHSLRNVSFIPVDLPNYYRCASKHLPFTIFTAQVSPMDENGNFAVGFNQTLEADAIKDALEDHRTIILEVNPNLTNMRGSIHIPVEAVTCLYEVDMPEYCIATPPPTQEEHRVGVRVAELIEDGDCIQMGIGGIPDMVGAELMGKRDLGLHTEQFTSSMARLIEAGVITGARKPVDTGLHVGVFADGVHELYAYLHKNPNCVLRPGREILNPNAIARQDHMVSINTIIEMDLTGQACAESIGPMQYSGSGGSFCFLQGCFYADHGKGILCFTSRTKKGMPKIKAQLTPGAIVTHQRNYIQYVVTEYGAADLRGTTVRERARALISLAHPEDREELTRQAKELCYF